MKIRRLKTSILAILLLTVTACQDYTHYHSYRSAPKAGWHRNDTLVYSLSGPITPLDHEFSIGIRHKDTYPYRDLWITVNGDTLHLYLADSIGNWQGKGIGNTRQLALPWKNTGASRDSVFRITHIMKDSLLPDILDIGLQVRRRP